MNEVLHASLPYIRNMVFRIVGSVPELDDLQQVVLERVVAGLPTFREDSSFSTWVGSICLNVARQHRWYARREQAAFAPEETGLEVGADAPSAHGRAEAAEELGICRRVLDQLSVEQRTVYILCGMLGHTIDEACEMMGAARSTTRLRLYYARKRFAKLYAEAKRRRQR
jgi:RNA polymerase sigma-70 factor (ECF subfamily)